jgi:hypothetical protein
MSRDFLAYAIYNDKYSFFSDPWCGSLSGTMHEIGHNMGMGKRTERPILSNSQNILFPYNLVSFVSNIIRSFRSDR